MDELDSGIAVHSYTGIQMWMSWTLGLQSIPTQAYKCFVSPGNQYLIYQTHLMTGLDNPLLHSQCRALRGSLNFTASAPQRKIAVLHKQTRAAIGIVDPSGFHPSANPGLLLRLKIAAPK